MDLCGSGESTRAILLFFLIFFPLGIVAEVVNRPNWNEAQWKTELETFLRKYPPMDIEPEVGPIPIPELIDCALNLPKKSATCSDRFRTALLNEVLLRKQFKDYKEDCNSFGTKESDLVLNAPIQEKRRLDYPKYFIWQEKLINSKVELCDPHAFLRCSAERKCVCLSGSVRVGNICVYSHNTPCTKRDRPFFESSGEQYFDPFDRHDLDSNSNPFGLIGNLEVQIAPGCQEKDDRCVEYFYYTYHREKAYCVHDETGPVRRRWARLVDYFNENSIRPLPFSTKCSFQEHNHNRLFTSTKEEDENFEVRLKTLEEIKNRGVRFCDLKKFLTCGPSEKCECMAPSSEKDGKCVLPVQMNKCQLDPTMEPILLNKTLVPRARRELMIGFARGMTAKACKKPLECHADMTEVYCTCPPGRTGEDCNDTLTRFLPIVRVPSLPTDLERYSNQIKIFGDFNTQAVKFEKIFRLGEGDVCVWKTQSAAEMLVGRIQILKYRGMSKKKYEELSKKIEDFTTSHQSRGICNETLRCQYSTNKCVRQNRQNYLQDIRKEVEKSKTLKCNESGCSEFPRLDDVMVGGKETDFFGEDEMGYSETIQRLSKFLNMNPKLCGADGGSCSERTQGVCDCRPLSFAHYSHSPNHLALLSFVAMVFGVSHC